MLTTRNNEKSGGNVTLFLHLGLHKTGTTFLQHTLKDNADWLAEQGALFPVTGRDGSNRRTAPDAWSGHAALSKAIRAEKTGAKGRAVLQDLRDEISASGASKVIISSETLFHPKIPAYILQWFADTDIARVIPVVYLRRQDKFAEAIYLERLNWANKVERRSLPRFLKEEGALWLGYQNRLRPLRQMFAKSPPIIRSYDDAVAGPGLLADFMDVLGFTGVPATPRAIIHPSGNPALANLLVALNRRDDISPARKAEISLSIKTDKIWQATPKEQGTSLLNDRQWNMLKTRYEAQNHNLAARFMSGPTALFQFPQTRPAVTETTQRYTVSEALALSYKLFPIEEN